jgi:hypothetical protein
VAVAEPLNLRAAAKLAGVAPSTLLQALIRGEGPKGNMIYRPRGQRRIFEFTPEDVLAWKAQREQRVPIGGRNGTD